MRLNAIPGCDGKNPVNIKKDSEKFGKLLRGMLQYLPTSLIILPDRFSGVYFLCAHFSIFNPGSGRSEKE